MNECLMRPGVCECVMFVLCLLFVFCFLTVENMNECLMVLCLVLFVVRPFFVLCVYECR